MAHRCLNGIFRILVTCFALASLTRAVDAQCKCPVPRPLHATATSGVITMAFREEFNVEVSEPPSVEIVIATDYNNIVDALEDVRRKIEGTTRESIKATGFQGEVKIRWVYSATATFSGNGFEFLNNQSGNVEGNHEANFNIYGRTINETDGQHRGVFEAEVKLRAKVCVEANETHLTFNSETRKRMRHVPVDSRVIPPEVFEQKKQEFENRVAAEVNRVERELTALRYPLSMARQREIREHTVEQFDEKLSVRFFNQPYEFPVRVVPLQQVRMCSPTIGD